MRMRHVYTGITICYFWITTFLTLKIFASVKMANDRLVLISSKIICTIIEFFFVFFLENKIDNRN